ncbi:MAG: AraC family transcriptional regulator [Vicinamibacterales bacterium]
MTRVHTRSSASRTRSSDPMTGGDASAAIAGTDLQRLGFDVLSDVLRSVHLTGSMLFLVEGAAPWMSWAPETQAFRRLVLPRSQHMVSFHLVTDGACWAGLQGEAPQCFGAGDAMVVPHGDAYYLCDPPGTEPAYGRRQAIDFFQMMAGGRLPPTVTQGERGRRTRFVCGFLGIDALPFNPVLAALPRMVRVPGVAVPAADDPTLAPPTDPMSHLTRFALAKLGTATAGLQSIVLKLAELMFIEVIRRHLTSETATSAGWLAGLSDPVVARALACLHQHPARHWTLGRLAAECGASRTVVTERFALLVGTPPMQYLALWRMQAASRLLAEPAAKVGAVAREVGYESEAAFSRQFKKVTGVPPAAWRRSLGTTSNGSARRST